MITDAEVIETLKRLVPRSSVEILEDHADEEFALIEDPIMAFFEALDLYARSLKKVYEDEKGQILMGHQLVMRAMRATKTGPRAMESKFDASYCQVCMGKTIERGERILFATGVGAMHESPSHCAKKVKTATDSKYYAERHRKIVVAMELEDEK